MEDMNNTLMMLFNDNHNGSGKADQHLLIKVTPSHSTSAKGGGNTATSNTTDKTNGADVPTREEIMSKASTLAKNQRSAAAAEKSVVDSTDTLIPEKSKVDSTNVSTVKTRASKKAADAATAKQGDTASSILEKSTTKEVVDSTAVEQVANAEVSKKAATVVPSIRGAAFTRAKDINAKAKNERAQRVDVAVISVLGSMSKEVAAGILECYQESVSESKQHVQSTLRGMDVDIEQQTDKLNELVTQINTLEQILADKDLSPDSDYRLTKERRLADARDEMNKIEIVKIKKDELAQLNKDYTELFKDAMMYHNKLAMFEMDQSEIVKLGKEWEENLAKTTWEHL